MIRAPAAVALIAVLGFAPRARAVPPPKRSALEISGWVLVGVGAASFGSGFIARDFRVRATKRAVALADQRGPTGFSSVVWADVLRQRALAQRATVAVAGTFTAALVLVTTGAVLVATGRTRRLHPVALSLFPTRGGAAFSTKVRF